VPGFSPHGGVLPKVSVIYPSFAHQQQSGYLTIELPPLHGASRAADSRLLYERRMCTSDIPSGNAPSWLSALLPAHQRLWFLVKARYYFMRL